MQDEQKTKEQLLDEVRELRQRLTEPAARQQDAQYKWLEEGVLDYALCTLDPEGIVTGWNAGAERLTGYREPEILGRHFSCLYPAGDVSRAKPQEALQQAAAQDRIQEEGWRLRKDGSRFWATILIMALREESGRLRGFAALTRDITEAKGTRDALADQSRVFQAVLASIAEGVVVADARGKFLVWNAAAEQMIGLGPADTPLDKWAGLYGCYLPDMQTPYPTDRLPLVRALRGEAVNEEEMFLKNAKRPAGVWLSVNARPLHFEDGTVHGGVVVFRDITEHKRAAAR